MFPAFLRTMHRGAAARLLFASAPVVEALEARQLLSQYTYTVPPGHAVAYIQPFLNALAPREVLVRLDDPVTGPIGHEFTNTEGMDIIDAGSNENFRFVDQVAARLKPGGDPQGDNGLLVRAGGGAELRVEAQETEIDSSVFRDNLIQVKNTTTTSGTVEVKDSGGSLGETRFADGVDKLTLRTTDYPAHAFYSDAGDGTQIDVANDEPERGALPPNVQLTVDTGAGTYDTVNLGNDFTFLASNFNMTAYPTS